MRAPVLADFRSRANAFGITRRFRRGPDRHAEPADLQRFLADAGCGIGHTRPDFQGAALSEIKRNFIGGQWIAADQARESRRKLRYVTTCFRVSILQCRPVLKPKPNDGHGGTKP